MVKEEVGVGQGPMKSPSVVTSLSCSAIVLSLFAFMFNLGVYTAADILLCPKLRKLMIVCVWI